MLRKENTLWVEKYRPDVLENYVGNSEIKDKIESYIKSADIPNLLLCGKAGTGKTTLAKIIVNNIDCDYLYINASDKSGVDFIRNEIIPFASSAGFRDLKIVILDEFDFMSPNAMAALRNAMETFSKHCRFILTCNYVEKIIDPIQSRCQVFQITPPSKKEVAQHISDILYKEYINYEVSDLVLVVNKHYPDIRKILNTCQVNNVDGKLVIDDLILTSSNYTDTILKELKSVNKNSFKNIRQILADSNLDDFEEIYRFLYDNLDEYTKDDVQQAMIIIEIENYMYHANFRIDKEINVMALISKILQTIQ